MRHRRIALAIVPVLVLAGAALDPATAQEKSLDIELNKLEEIGGQCNATFVLRNRTGENLEHIRLDLYIFDKNGIVTRRLLLDTAPMPDDKTSVASFAILEQPCAEIGRLLINDVPVCKSRSGNAVDCVAALNPSSRAAIDLAK